MKNKKNLHDESLQLDEESPQLDDDSPHRDKQNSQLGAQSPWLEEKDWINGQIHSSARGAFYLSLVFALVWNAISFPIAFIAISDSSVANFWHDWKIEHLDPVLFVLLFPLIGIGLIFWAYKTYRQWSVFGRLSLTLDPYPGSIGGEVGGFMELPVNWRSGYDFKVTVNCIHHTITRSGKNSSHNQRVVWKKHAAVEYEPSAKGIGLKFKCPIDDGLHDSESKSGRSYYRWVAHIKAQDQQSKIALDREFDIPVFKLDTPQRSHLYIASPVPEIDVEQISEEQVQIKQKNRSLELIYPRSRYASIGKGLFVVALVFLSATGFLGYETWSEIHHRSAFNFFSMGVTGFMTLIFGMVSLIMLGFALHLLSNRLQVQINSRAITVTSQSLLYHSQKTASLSQIKTISKKTTMSSGQGASATLYFTVTALLDNQQKLTLGNGIKGQLVADSIIKLINKQLKNTSTAIPVVNAIDDTYSPLVNTDAKKAAAYVNKYRWLVNLIAFIFMILFLFQFLSFF